MVVLMSDDVVIAGKRTLARTLEAGERAVDFDLTKRNAIFDDLQTRLKGYGLIRYIYVVPHVQRNKDVKLINKLSVTSECDLVHGGAVYFPPVGDSPARIDVLLETKEISSAQYNGLVQLVDDALRV